MSVQPRQYFTAAELAALALPALGRSKRRINDRALAERWALKADDNGAPLARPRQGRGGGLEYHLSLLPASARMELVKRGIAAAETDAPASVSTSDNGSWAWFERQSDAVKAEAGRRLRAVDRVDALMAGGLTRSAAVACVSAESGTAGSTLWNWLNMIDGADRSGRLPALAPRRQGGGATADIDPAVWRFFVSDYLRAGEPTLASCHRRTAEFARLRGLSVPHSRTLQRKLERELDPRLVVARRRGMDAALLALPPQMRTVAGLHALQVINIDGHIWDCRVRFPNGRVARPMMIGVQDVYSRRFLAWRLAESENQAAVRLALADVFRRYGIPEICVSDNGRAFASKWITGGALYRNRFKIKDEEPIGLLTALGVRVLFTNPYSGQSKPIERTFRDIEDEVSKHPALDGAYTGNHIDSKPHNYGERAIEFDQFVREVRRGIAAHNARRGRKGGVCNGRSFDETFEESYRRFPVRKATDEQLRYALLAAEDVRTDRNSGAITVMDNRYWCDELSMRAGQRVTVRFDPEDLSAPLFVYDREGRFIAEAPLFGAVGFLDAEAAKSRARAKSELRRTIRKAEQIEQLLSAEELAARIPYPDEAEELPEATVIRPIRPRRDGAAAAQLAVTHPQPAVIDRIATAAANRLRLVQD